MNDKHNTLPNMSQTIEFTLDEATQFLKAKVEDKDTIRHFTTTYQAQAEVCDMVQAGNYEYKCMEYDEVCYNKWFGVSVMRLTINGKVTIMEEIFIEDTDNIKEMRSHNRYMKKHLEFQKEDIASRY